MPIDRTACSQAVFAAGCFLGLACAASAQSTPAVVLQPSTLKTLGTVDRRFQSYNIEMVEVTGGRFWKPYAVVDAERAAKPETKAPAGNQPIGIDPSLFWYRPPIDLTNARLRQMAAALGPAYVPVSGTWQNTTYFQDSDAPAPAPASPPAGFNGVLTRAEWKGVLDFAKAVDAGVVTSLAVSAGTRGPDGVWTSDQAARLLVYTKAAGSRIAAIEYMNEPTMATIGGAPRGYDAKAYARDVAVFTPFLRRVSPGTVILGPGSVGEGSDLMPAGMLQLKTEDMLAATGPVSDVISYHFYGGVSSRCTGPMGAAQGTSAEKALSDDWLNRNLLSEEFYAKLRDRFEPGKPIWLTETGQTACGGDRWASTFLDSFRYLNQLGALAQRGVQVVAHNTLAASDYALLNPDFTPRPNYWSALLWHQLMGTTVLDPGVAPLPAVHVYAHCLGGTPGGVSLLVINASRAASYALTVPKGGERYTLTAAELTSAAVLLNRHALKLNADDTLPTLHGEKTAAGAISFAPASITFLALPRAGNAGCR